MHASLRSWTLSRRVKGISKVGKFIASNFLGTVVDTAVLWLFSHLVFSSYFGVNILSPFISYECAVFCNFCCSFYFIWRSRVRRGSLSYFLRKYLIYNLSCTGSFIVKMMFLLAVEKLFHLDVVICNLIALCFSGVLNFSLGEWVIFKKAKTHESIPS